MLYQHKATQVTSGAPDETQNLRQLARFYPYPDTLDRPFVRANMVASVDGASSVQGRSGGLGGPGDRAIFRLLRGLADVVVVGARTALTEGYRQPTPDEAFGAMRAEQGQSPAPMLALISNSLSIDPDYPPLADPATMVLTCSDASEQRRRTLTDRGATVVDCGSEAVRIGRVLDHLAALGLPRVLCEGGPSLLGAVVAEDLLDELCLTTSPMIVAGDTARIVTGAALPELAQMRPGHLLSDDDGYVYTRWTRAS